tara:strand:+ start:494 stop:889 length:396 start_codon:yes stop_codon:yes gene_type:complete
MGADLLVSSVPKFELTKDRKDELEVLISELDDGDVRAFEDSFMDEIYEAGSENARGIIIETLKKDLDKLDDIENRRNVIAMRFPGMEYEVWLTGEMSWGDTTEQLTLFDQLDFLWDKMQKYAEEDFAKERS